MQSRTASEFLSETVVRRVQALACGESLCTAFSRSVCDDTAPVDCIRHVREKFEVPQRGASGSEAQLLRWTYAVQKHFPKTRRIRIRMVGLFNQAVLPSLQFGMYST